MKISCIAVDDEPLALELISDYAKRVPFLKLVKTFSSALDALEYITINKIDLIFLDIQMKQFTGIQLVNIIKNKPLVIFTTAFDKYAVKGYELDIVDYLLKPISFERFVKAAEKAYEKMKSVQDTRNCIPETVHTSSCEKFFFVKTEFRLQKVNFEDILYIEGKGDYLQIVTKDCKIMTLQNFRNLEEILPFENFCRVHKSFLVSLDKINIIEKSIINIGDVHIPVSDSYKSRFFDLLKKRHLILAN